MPRQRAAAHGALIDSEGGKGVCWLVHIEGRGETVFLVLMLGGMWRVQSMGELLAAIGCLAAPSPLSFDNWPGCQIRVVV